MSLFGSLLPRHLEIIFEINRRFLDEVRIRYPNDDERVRRVSLIDERGPEVRPHGAPGERRQPRDQRCRRLHTELLERGVLRDFHDLYPDTIPQRHQRCDAETLDGGLQPGPHSPDYRGHRRSVDCATPNRSCRASSRSPTTARSASRGGSVQRANRWRWPREIEKHAGVPIDPDSLFDVQVKRIHEYKRQHLNVLHIITRYLRLLETSRRCAVPDDGVCRQGGARLRGWRS